MKPVKSFNVQFIGRPILTEKKPVEHIVLFSQIGVGTTMQKLFDFAAELTMPMFESSPLMPPPGVFGKTQTRVQYFNILKYYVITSILYLGCKTHREAQTVAMWDLEDQIRKTKQKEIFQKICYVYDQEIRNNIVFKKDRGEF